MTEIHGPVHLVGIGGIHMSAIGQLLLEAPASGLAELARARLVRLVCHV